VAEQLGEVGIRAKLEFTEWLTYFGAWAGGMKPGVGLNIMSWGMNSPWWLNHVFVNFNTGHIRDPRIVRLLAQADRETDTAKRLRLYQQVSRIDVERAYHAPMYTDALAVVTSPSVKGFVHAKNWWFDLSTARVS
jgi:ABC-type transport system substrate-binding protein